MRKLFVWLTFALLIKIKNNEYFLFFCKSMLTLQVQNLYKNMHYETTQNSPIYHISF